MTYHIAIVDDNQTDREFLHAQAQSWAAQRGCTLQAELFASAEEFLFHYYDSEEGQAAFEEWLKQREDTEDA